MGGRLAKDDRAHCAKPSYHRAVLAGGRGIVIGTTPAPRWEASDIEDIFDGHRDAMERSPQLAPCQLAIEVHRGPMSALPIDQHEGPQLGLDLIDTFEDRIKEC